MNTVRCNAPKPTCRSVSVALRSLPTQPRAVLNSRTLHKRFPNPPRAEKADASEASAAAAEEPEPNVCATCGVPLSEMPGGCDGKGRQVGGVGAVIDWWPIKAYRPCPALTASGGKYKRKGQITDEMLFGKGKK